MARFFVSYDVVTPESAEFGDFAERGSVDRYGYRWPVEPDPAKRNPDDCGMTLREALNLCNPQEDAGHWFAEVDGRENYQTGASERRALHPPRNITPASYGRLARLLNV